MGVEYLVVFFYIYIYHLYVYCIVMQESVISDVILTSLMDEVNESKQANVPAQGPVFGS